MKTYFISVILTAVFGGICEELLPESSSVRPHVKLVTGLCVLLVLILPAKDLLLGMGDFFGSIDLSELAMGSGDTEDYESMFEDALSRYSKEESERYLEKMIEERFGLSEETCRVSAAFLEDGALSRVWVVLSGASILQSPYEIEAYVNEKLSCPCDVAVE